MKTIKAYKKRLRDEIKQKIKLFDGAFISGSNERVKDNLENLQEYRDANTVFCFVSTEDEIDTRLIISDALAGKKRVCVPKCLKMGVMEAREIKSLDDLEEGNYGICEPKNDCGVIEPENIDFAIIPCVTCDINGYRLGYGGGFYDRYLAQAGFVTAVLCRHVLISDVVPVENHDIQTDFVITDKWVYAKGQQINTNCQNPS